MTPGDGPRRRQADLLHGQGNALDAERTDAAWDARQAPRSARRSGRRRRRCLATQAGGFDLEDGFGVIVHPRTMR